MKRSVYIFSSGELCRKQNTLYFESEKSRKYIPVENTAELYCFGEVSLNKKLLEFLCQCEIMLHFFNYHGYYVGSFYPREHYNSGHMILAQAAHYMDEAKRLDIARLFVIGAVRNIDRVIGYYANRGKDLTQYQEKIAALAKTLPERRTTEELMAIEGNIREQYYHCFDVILDKPDFVFAGRTRQPPTNRLNALISFGNSMLYVSVLSEIYKTHLDPRIGYLHSTNFRRFSLNLDVAEVFKPIIVDRIIFTLVNKGMLEPKSFHQESGGMFLTDAGRRTFVEEYDKRMGTVVDVRELDKEVSYRRLVRVELYKLEKHLLGEKRYEPYTSRW